MPTRDFFFETIRAGLKGRTLERHVPQGYPEKGSGAVDYDNALSFELKRNDRYAHNFNLPLLLHLAGHSGAIPGVRKVAASMLDAFDTFIQYFPDTPGLRATLEPLWSGPWDDQPVFWSVLAHCHMAVELKRGGCTVLGFNVLTGYLKRDADIHLRKPDGGEVLLDIEMWNEPKATTRQALLDEARSRSKAKAQHKFGTLAPAKPGRISQVMMPQSLDAVQMLRDNPDMMAPFDLSPTCRGEIAAFGGIGDRDGRLHGLDFLRFGSNVRPVPPGATTSPRTGGA